MKGIRIILAAGLILLAQACTEKKQNGQEDQSSNKQKSKEMEEISPKDFATFKVSDQVKMYKVTFKNQYKMYVAGHLFIPDSLDRNAKNAAIIVGHPMGAVKEQSADVYASNMAGRGFITLAIDLSFWGESEGQPRNAVLPDVYAEDFSAAVDFLGTRPFVDREKNWCNWCLWKWKFCNQCGKDRP